MYLFYQKHKYSFNILTKPFHDLSIKKLLSLLINTKLNFLSLFFLLLSQIKINYRGKHNAQTIYR